MLKASEWVLISLLALSMAARIAGCKFFEAFYDLRIRIVGVRFRIMSAALLFAASMIAVFTKDIPSVARIVGGFCIPIGTGMMVWEINLVLALISEQSIKEEGRR